MGSVPVWCVLGGRVRKNSDWQTCSSVQGLHQKGVSLLPLAASKHTLEATEGNVVEEIPAPERGVFS